MFSNPQEILSIWEGQMGAIWPILTGIFLVILGVWACAFTIQRSALKSKNVASIMSDGPHTISPQNTLLELVDQTILHHCVSFVPVVEGEKLLGYINTQVLKTIDKENWVNTTVGDVFVTLEEAQTVSPDLPIERLLGRLQNSTYPKLMVVENGQLLGVVSLPDICRYLTVCKDLKRRP